MLIPGHEEEWRYLLHISMSDSLTPAFLAETMSWLASLEWLNLSPRWMFFLPQLSTFGSPSLMHSGQDDDLTQALQSVEFACRSQADWNLCSLPVAASGQGLPAHGLCCLPLRTSQRHLSGVACFFFQPPRQPSEPELAFLQSAVCLLASAFRRRLAEIRLHAREKILFEHSSRIILLLNPDQTVRYINRKGCELLGYNEAEIINKNWVRHFMPERLQAQASDLFRKLLRRELKELDDFAMHVLARNQPERLIAWHWCLLADGDNDHLTLPIFCSGEDITQRHKNDEALWERSLRDRYLFQNSPIALWEIDDTQLQARIASLRERPDWSLRSWLDASPAALEDMWSLVQVKESNRAAHNLLLMLRPSGQDSDLQSLLTPSSYPSIKNFILWLSEGVSVFKAEIYISIREDQPFFGDLQVSPLTNAGRCNHHYLLSVLDISRQRIIENTLQENLARYSSFFEDSPIAILQIEFDLQTLMQTFQPSNIQDICASFWQTPDGIDRFLKYIRVMEANRAAKDFFDAQSPFEIQEILPHILKSGTVDALHSIIPFLLTKSSRIVESEFSGLTPKGQPICAFVRISLVSDTSSGRLQALASITDISERVKLEESLRNSEQTQRALVENLGIGVLSMNRKCEILTVNRQMRKWFPGVDSQANAVCVHISATRPEANVCQYCPVTATRNDGRVHESITCIPQNGVPAYYRIVSSPLRDADDNVPAIIVLMENVTVKYLMEQQLQKTHERIEHLMSAIPSILITLDENDLVINWNPMAEKAFGLNAVQTLGKRFTDSGISWDWEKLLVSVRESRASYINCQLANFHFQHPDGKTGVLDLIITPVKVDDLASSDILILGTDLSDRILLQQQLLQAQKLESIGQLAAGIAHEINTPTQYVGDNLRFLKEAFGDILILLEKYSSLLAACRPLPAVASPVAEIQSVLETADCDYLEAEIPKALLQSLEGVERVTGIVRAMKDFAHPDTGEKAPVNLNQAISSTVTVARNEWKYVADVRLDFDPGLPAVPCLPGEFNQVILNMIVNAAHAIGDTLCPEKPAKGLIVISTRVSQPWAEIRIADNGSGIPPHVLPKIFDPFFTTKKIGKGSGQGLPISRNVIVEKHGGSINVETEVGKGTTFIIRLPLQVQASPANEVR